jgi:hypothetical protein
MAVVSAHNLTPEPDPGSLSTPDPAAHPTPTSSLLENALADLLAAPFDKVSITIPAALKSRIAMRLAKSADSNFSSYVTEVLAREERRRALVDFLDYMDDLYGPPSEEDMADIDRRLEEMWEKYEAYQSAQSSSMPVQ